MHELIATQRILDAALEQADPADGRRVRAVRLELGALAGVTEPSIRFYWDLLTPGTLAAGSSLDVRLVPGTIRCRACGQVSETDDAFPICPACASVDLAVLAGDGVVIAAVETALSDEATGAAVAVVGPPAA